MNKLLLLCFCLIPILCVPSKAQHCYDAGKKNHFRFKLLKTGMYIDTNYVRVDGVYLLQYFSEANKRKEYTYGRFFPNGRAYFSSVYCSFPNENELNELDYGWYGYYRVDNNRITEETYSAAAGYYFHYYYITGNSITSSATKTRTWGIFKAKEVPSPESTYTFYPYKLKSTTFW